MKDKYVKHEFALTDQMKRKIRAHLKSNGKGPLSLKFTPCALNGHDTLLVTPTIKQKIEKAIQQRKGLQIKFSPTMLQANQKGGFLSTILSILQPVQELVGSFVSPDFQSKIDNYLHGKGVKDIQSDAFTQGMQMAQQMKGHGFTEDWNGFWNGFAYGFSNPIGAFQVLGKAITGKGTCQTGSGIKFY